MPLLKGNLHSHTVLSDGLKTPWEVIARYSVLGYDFVAITDHAEQIPRDYWHRIPRYAAGVLIFPGVEIEWSGLRQHVGKILGDDESLYVLNHPSRYGLSVADTLKRIELLRGQGIPIRAIEVTSGGVYHPQYNVDEIPFPKVATDDTHKDLHFGRAWIEVSAERKRDAILKAIKAGDFRMGFDHGDEAKSGADRSGGWWEKTISSCARFSRSLRAGRVV